MKNNEVSLKKINNDSVQHVFIVGCKGIPANYGGFETFVDKLTEYSDSNKIKYHVACLGKEEEHFEYNGASCFRVKVADLKSATAIVYDIKALNRVYNYIRKNKIKNPIVYVLACRIGPFIKSFKKKINSVGGKLYINPDGHEWKRAKWSAPVKLYWRISEKLMIKHSDKVICDSENIEKYIKKTYKNYNPDTCYISYGAEIRPSMLSDDDTKIVRWNEKNKVRPHEYYLVVGRFVPENNFDSMIREFMRSKTKKDLVIITTANDKFLAKLENKFHFESDSRIKFVGTVYDKELLLKIRQNAYAYIHGHEVGGTNPSLLEALGSTELNLLYKVGFNYEVAKDAAVYWTKEDGDLARLIDTVDNMPAEKRIVYEGRAKKRIQQAYSWEGITREYYNIFLGNGH